MIRKNGIKEGPERIHKPQFSPQRRNFGKTVLAGVIGGKTLLSFPGISFAAKKNTSKMRLSAQVENTFLDDDLTFIKQMGVQYLTTWVRTPQEATYENFVKLREKADRYDLKIATIGNMLVHNMEEVTLNLPGRDKKIEEYQQNLRNLGRAGIHTTVYSHMATGVTSSKRETTRGDASTRAYETGKRLKEESYSFKTFTHDRLYTEDELWENYAYFIKQAAPVAEEYKVKIAMHPEDPPGQTLGNVPRCIFSSFEGYKRAIEIANSDYVGMCLCCGCVLEAGDEWGKDILETIHYFGKRGKIHKVHFRNVNQPLPHFVETFIDDGYYDMSKIMKALKQEDTDCVLIADHWPDMVGGRRTGLAFTTGYIKALLERANEEICT
jgi:mannonate dehydratase